MTDDRIALDNICRHHSSLVNDVPCPVERRSIGQLQMLEIVNGKPRALYDSQDIDAFINPFFPDAWAPRILPVSGLNSSFRLIIVAPG